MSTKNAEVWDVDFWRNDVQRITEMVNATEQIHKVSQLYGSPLSIPILNESRYLARALVDALNDAVAGQGSTIVQSKLTRARLAASSALHDAVDELLALTMQGIIAIERELALRECQTNLGLYLDQDWRLRYRKYLEAYREIAAEVAHARAERDVREDIYLRLVSGRKDNGLDTIIDFLQRLREFGLTVTEESNKNLS